MIKKRAIISGILIFLFFFFCCGTGLPVKTPLSGNVVDKDTGLPIENVLVLRSWDKFDAIPPDRSTSHLKHEETLTDAYGRFRFSISFVASVGIPIFSGTEENNLIAYKPGYNFQDVQPHSKEILLEKTPETYYRRYEESEKAYGNYSVDYHKTKQLQSIVELEKLLNQRRSRYAKGLFYGFMPVDDIGFGPKGNVILSSNGRLYSYERSADGALGEPLEAYGISQGYPADIELDSDSTILAFSKTTAVRVNIQPRDIFTRDVFRHPVTPLASTNQIYSLFDNYNDPKVAVIPGRGFYVFLPAKAEFRGFDLNAKQVCSYPVDRSTDGFIDIVKGKENSIIVGRNSTNGTTFLFFDQDCKLMSSKHIEPLGQQIRSLTSSIDGTLFISTGDTVYSVNSDLSLSKIVSLQELSWGEFNLSRIKVDPTAENLFIIDKRYDRVFLYDLKEHLWNESGSDKYEIYGKVKSPRANPMTPFALPQKAEMPAVQRNHLAFPAGNVSEGVDKYSAAERRFREIVANNPDAVIKSLNDDDNVIRKAAATALGYSDKRRAVISLMKALHDKDMGVKRIAIKSLGKIKDPLPVDSLIDELVNRSSHYNIRSAAAQALGEIRALKAEKVLIDCLTEPVTEEGGYPALFRILTIRALGQLKSKAAIKHILTILSATRNQEIREEAISALGEIGDQSATLPLVRLLKNEPKLKLNLGNGMYVSPDKDKRIKLIVALGKIADPITLPIFSELANDDNPIVLRETVKALIMFKSNKTVVPLCTAIRNSNDKETKKMAFESIVALGHTATLKLVKLLDDNDPKIRMIAAQILGEIADVSSVKGLIKALQDNDKSVRNAAADSLGRFNNPAAIDALEKAVKDPTVTYSAVHALANIGSPSVQPLVRILEQNEVKLQVYVADILIDIGEPSIMPLKQYLLRNDVVLNTLVRWIYYHIGKRSPESILSALRDDNEFVRSQAVEIIGNVGSPNTIDSLVLLVKNEHSPLVISRAIEALGKTRDIKIRSVVASAIKHKSPLVRKAADWALRQF